MKLLIGEAALFLNRPAGTLRRWDREGLFKARRTTGGYRWYSIDKLEQLKKKLGNGKLNAR